MDNGSRFDTKDEPEATIASEFSSVLNQLHSTNTGYLAFRYRLFCDKAMPDLAYQGEVRHPVSVLTLPDRIACYQSPFLCPRFSGVLSSIWLRDRTPITGRSPR